MKYTLAAAALLNVCAGIWVIVWPGTLFAMVGLPQPRYPELWQVLGILVVAFGVGYAIAASDPYRHWPVILAGFLGKIGGPVILVSAALHHRFPLFIGLPVIASDVIWWLPFVLILRGAWEEYLSSIRQYSPEVLSFAFRTKLDNGLSIEQMSRKSPVLMVFLRHAGCMFCRQTLADIAKQRRDLEKAGVTIMLVHMGDREFGRKFVSKYGLDDLPRISDPNCTLYRAFGLRRSDWRMALGISVWWRALYAAVIEGHGVGRHVGDVFQMPGVFLVFHGQVLRSYRHYHVADRPDYLGFAKSGLREAII